MGLRNEILEQPDVLRRWLEIELPSVQQIARVVRERSVEFAFLAARGTSDHAGTYAQYLWGSVNRLPVALAAPSLFTLYSESPRLSRALVVGISQSGESPDVVSVLAEGRRQGALTLAVTNAQESPLSQTAEFTINLHAGIETAVAATKTYTAELMAVAALSAVLTGEGEYLEALDRIPDAVRQALAVEEEVAGIAERHKELQHCVILARGYNYATAQEAALKLKELAYVFADPYSAADFMHGPIAIVEPGFPLHVIAPRGAAFADLLALLQRFRDEYHAELLVASDDPAALALAHSAIRLPGRVPEWLSPLVAIVPLQLYGYYLTRAKGYDPESPRGLRKVTLTR